MTKSLVATILAVCVTANLVEPLLGVDSQQKASLMLTSGDTKMRHMIQYSVYALKGSILGFQQGLLNDERIRLSDDCFGSDEVNADLIFMSDFSARKKSIWDAYKFTKIGSEMLINEMDHCNWTSTVSLLQEFCHSHDY